MRYLFFIAIFIASTALYSQSKNQFKFVEQKNGLYETVFTIIGNTSTQNIENIIKDITSYEEVSSCQIFYNRRCKVTSTRTLPIKGVRRILNKYDVYLDVSYCIINNKELYIELKQKKESFSAVKLNHIPVSDWVFPEDYPTKEKIKDKLELKEAIYEWIENNPNKWKAITGREYLDYSYILE